MLLKQNKIYFCFIIGILFSLVLSLITFSEVGLTNPPGELVEDVNILTVSPTSFTLSSTQTEIQITLTAKDPYVYKDAYFCKAPCRQLSDWIFLGEFTGTPKGGNYLDGKGNGVSNQFTISKSNLNSGNNFVAVYTCKGYNNCNTKKWLKQSFIVSLVDCNVNSDCAAGLICSNAQCVANCGDGICGAGETCAQDSCCAGIAKNLLSDNSNCGACGNLCGASSTCNNNRYTSTGPSADGGGLGIVNGCTRMPCIGGSCVCNDNGDPDCYDCYGNFNPACG